jgi:hypothetical protein
MYVCTCIYIYISYIHIHIHIHNKQNITHTQAPSSFTDSFSTYPFFILRSFSPHYTISNPHIWLSHSYSFMLVAGWRLSYSYRCFLPSRESENARTHYHKRIFQWHGNTRAIWRPEANWAGHRLPRENGNKWDHYWKCLYSSPNLWHLAADTSATEGERYRTMCFPILSQRVPSVYSLICWHNRPICL